MSYISYVYQTYSKLIFLNFLYLYYFKIYEIANFWIQVFKGIQYLNIIAQILMNFHQIIRICIFWIFKSVEFQIFRLNWTKSKLTLIQQIIL